MISDAPPYADLFREVPPTVCAGGGDQEDETRQESSGHRLLVARAIVDEGAYAAARCRAPGSTIRAARLVTPPMTQTVTRAALDR